MYNKLITQLSHICLMVPAAVRTDADVKELHALVGFINIELTPYAMGMLDERAAVQVYVLSPFTDRNLAIWHAFHRCDPSAMSPKIVTKTVNKNLMLRRSTSDCVTR